MINKKKKKGFTLIELIVVIAILGILAAIAVPRFSTMQNNSKVKADKATAASIVNAAKVYISDNNCDLTAATGVKVANLVTASLLDAQPKSQQNNTVMEITIAGTSISSLTYSVSDGTWTATY